MKKFKPLKIDNNIKRSVPASTSIFVDRKNELDSVAEQHGITVSQLIRQLVYHAMEWPIDELTEYKPKGRNNEK